MKCLHIITPVKDSIDSTLETVKAIMESDILVPFTYTVYNDFSTEENTHRLEEAARQWNFRLVNLSDLTDHPSPNYLLVLQTAQKEAIEADAGLLIVESDVIVKKHIAITIQWSIATEAMRNCSGCDNRWKGVINYPYLHAKGHENQVYPEKSIAASAVHYSPPYCWKHLTFRH